MSKKHYIKFAQYIKNYLSAGNGAIAKSQIEREAQEMADMIVFCNDNPLFDKERFLKACGLN